MESKRGLAGRRPAVDADRAAQRSRRARGLQACTDREPSARRIEGGGHRPGERVGISTAASAAELVEASTPQAAARYQEGERLEEIGLAGAVGADQYDGLWTAVEPK